MQPCPGEEPRSLAGAGDVEGAVRVAVLVPPGVLRSDERGLRASDVAPAPAAVHGVAVLDHLVEEVVGGEEGQVAAPVAVALRQAVLVARRVLLVARENDHAVIARESRGAADPVEVVV